MSVLHLPSLTTFLTLLTHFQLSCSLQHRRWQSESIRSRERSHPQAALQQNVPLVCPPSFLACCTRSCTSMAPQRRPHPSRPARHARHAISSVTSTYSVFCLTKLFRYATGSSSSGRHSARPMHPGLPMSRDNGENPRNPLFSQWRGTQRSAELR